MSRKFQGVGLYELSDGNIVYCHPGGRVYPHNILVRDGVGQPVRMECVPEVFDGMAATYFEPPAV